MIYINSKWIIKIKPQTIKLEENKGETLFDTGLGSDFSDDVTSKA